MERGRLLDGILKKRREAVSNIDKIAIEEVEKTFVDKRIKVVRNDLDGKPEIEGLVTAILRCSQWPGGDVEFLFEIDKQKHVFVTPITEITIF